MLGAVGSGVMAIPWKLANEAGDPAISVLLLLGVAALINTALMVGQRLASGVLNLRMGRTELGVAATLAVFTLLGNLASARAIQDLSPALHSVLLRADVIFVAILGWLLLGERVERRFWVGALVALVGLVVLQGPMEQVGFRELIGSGTGMAVAAGAWFSLMAIVTRRFIHRIDPVAVNALRLWLSVALWFGFNGVPVFAEIPSDQLIHATSAAIAGPFFGRLALMISTRYIEVRATTLTTLTTPGFTLIMAFVFLADWPEAHQLLGAAIMIAGISIPLLRFGRAAPVVP